MKTRKSERKQVVFNADFGGAVRSKTPVEEARREASLEGFRGKLRELRDLVFKILPVPFTVSAPAKLKTKKSKVLIKGTASFGTAKVEVKVGKKGFKPARGTTSWSFNAGGLKRGKNKILVQATSANGLTATRTVIVIRK